MTNWTGYVQHVANNDTRTGEHETDRPFSLGDQADLVDLHMTLRLLVDALDRAGVLPSNFLDECVAMPPLGRWTVGDALGLPVPSSERSVDRLVHHAHIVEDAEREHARLRRQGGVAK